MKNNSNYSLFLQLFCMFNAVVPVFTKNSGYIPELNTIAESCCQHTASWDDPFSLMCRNCAYYTISLGEEMNHYYYTTDDGPDSEITCINHYRNNVFCSGKNNENGGRPYYSAHCDESCINRYKTC